MVITLPSSARKATTIIQPLTSNISPFRARTRTTDVRDYLDAFSKSDGSAQSFFELSDNIRDKDYNRSDNRKISSITYDNATILTVPEDALDWAFDKARTKGDVTTIRAEDCWYVLYFDGFARRPRA